MRREFPTSRVGAQGDPCAGRPRVEAVSGQGGRGRASMGAEPLGKVMQWGYSVVRAQSDRPNRDAERVLFLQGA